MRRADEAGKGCLQLFFKFKILTKKAAASIYYGIISINVFDALAASQLQFWSSGLGTLRGDSGLVALPLFGTGMTLAVAGLAP